MRAFLLPFLFALLAALPVRALAADPNEDIRRYVNGQWQLHFEESGTTKEGKPYKIGTIITITLRYDGTRTIAQDQIYNDEPLMRLAETNDYYRVDDIDGAKFTMTTWADDTPPSSSTRTRTGADTMMVEGSDAVYQRVANTQEGLLGAMPPQRDLPAAAPQPAPHPPAPPQPVPPAAEPNPAPPAPPQPPAPPASQEARDATARAIMVGKWTASLDRDGRQTVATTEYRTSGEMAGTQTVTFQGETKTYNFAGAYTVASTGPTTLSLTLYLSGQQPVVTEFQIVDQNTLYNARDNYRAVRAP